MKSTLISWFLILIVFGINIHNVSGQIHAGDTIQFWSVAYIDWQMYPPVPQRLINAVCKRAGERCYFFVDTAVHYEPSSQLIDSLGNIFDTNFVPLLTQLYGPLPDEFGNDSNVFILIIPNEGWQGYFDPAHQMPDSMVWRIWNKHSNQRKIIYVSSDAFNYDAKLILSHELGHMLLWGRDHSPEPAVNPSKYWEDAWIDESFATFASVYVLENILQPDIYDPQAFFAMNPDMSLIHFDEWNNYNLVKLWMQFMYEHYGGSFFIQTLINDQANGIAGVRNTLTGLGYTESFEDVFEHWILANYLDNTTYHNGKYGYNHYNFPVCKHSNTFNHFPVGIKTGSVSSFAADYIQFYSQTPVSVNIFFDGTDTSEFRIAFICLGNTNSQIQSVTYATPDSLNRVSFIADSLGMAYNKVIMVIMNTDTTLNIGAKTVYQYYASIVTEVNDIEDKSKEFRVYQNYPNPFNSSTTIQYELKQSSRVSLKIYNISGQEVRILINSYQQAGGYSAAWDGKNKYGSSVSTGLYLYRFECDGYSQTRKLMLLK